MARSQGTRRGELPSVPDHKDGGRDDSSLIRDVLQAVRNAMSSLLVEFNAVPPVRLHDIRHAHISQLFASGIDERVISDRVGHLGSKITRDYAAVATEVSRQAAEKAVPTIPRRQAR